MVWPERTSTRGVPSTHFCTVPLLFPRRFTRGVDQKQGCRSDDAARERRVWAGHGVLDGVGQQQEQRQVERGHLSCLALPNQAESAKDDGIYHRRSKRDLEKRPAVVPHVSFAVGNAPCHGWPLYRGRIVLAITVT